MADILAVQASVCCQPKAKARTQDSSREAAKAPRKAKKVKACSRRDAETQRKSKLEDARLLDAKALRKSNKTQPRSPGKQSAPGVSRRSSPRSRMRATRLSGLQNLFKLLPLPFSASPRLCERTPLTCLSFAPLRLRESCLSFLIQSVTRAIPRRWRGGSCRWFPSTTRRCAGSARPRIRRCRRGRCCLSCRS